MSLTYDQISAITEKKFLPKMIDNIFNSSAFLARLKKKERPQDGGDQILAPLNYAAATSVGWYQGADTLDTSDNETISAAAYDWRQLYGNITVTRRDELRNSGDAGKLNFVASKMKIVEKSMREALADGVFSSGTSKQVSGLGAIQSATSTLGGISGTTYSWWQAHVDSTTTTLTISALQSLWGDCGNGDTGEYPSLTLGDQSMFDRYYNLLQPSQRFQDAEVAKGGFVSLMFNGKPFLADSHATDGELHMINEEYIYLAPHKDENWRIEPFQKPINQNIRLSKIYWMGALICDNRRRHGIMSAITA